MECVVDVWIGLEFNPSDMFYWAADGQPLEWSNWPPEKPNKMRDNDADVIGAVLYYASGGWDDKPKSGRQGQEHLGL